MHGMYTYSQSFTGGRLIYRHYSCTASLRSILDMNFRLKNMRRAPSAVRCLHDLGQQLLPNGEDVERSWSK